MTTTKDFCTIPEEALLHKIYLLRNAKVMLDRDLADLLGVKPIRLREQVKRNPAKFPGHFMFQLSEKEVELLIAQQAIPSRQHLGGSMPYAFSEHGILMLANVLKSDLAIQMSILIIELFVKWREILYSNTDLKLEVENIKRKVKNHDQNIEIVFRYFDELLEQKAEPRRQIGFKVADI